MKIFVTGGTGFVGSFLTREFLRQGHEVTILTRRKELSAPAAPGGLRYVVGDPKKEGPWQAEVAGHDWVINLAGASIAARWTPEVKKELYNSRILTTRNVVAALAKAATVRLFCSTSAPGYYGPRGEEVLTEESPPGTDFLAQLARDWEAEALKAEGLGIRTVITRFGIVLGRDGGILGQLVPLFRKFLGGPVGSGTQWFSWIHWQDLVRAFLFLPDHPELTGPVNFTSPQPVRNRDFVRALARALKRPAFLPAPAFALRLVLGEMAEVILTGQRVMPKKLLEAGFEFLFPGIDQALMDLYGGKK